MSKFLKSLLATTAFLTLVPTAASARPEDCDELCTDAGNASCEDLCLWLGRIITCGDYDYGVCTGARAEPSDVTASVTQGEASQSEAASQVCSEEQQSTNHSTYAES